MIKKILNIQKVGRFNHFCGRCDELSFSKNTFIFGKNTQGKSTFTAILRSLASGNSDFIIGRKTFDTTTDQNVVIKTDDGQKIFNGTIWEGALDIKIFDSRFITENIYSDDYLDENKQNKIATIILGEKGKTLEKEYIEAKQKLDENSKAKTDITNQYNSTFDKSILEFKSFRKKEEKPSIDNDITKNNANLQAVKNQQNIKNLLENLSSYLSKLDDIDTAKICETLEVKQREIKDHILKNLKKEDGALRFLATGLSFLKEKINGKRRNCVFCGQELVTAEENLINAYTTLFSEAYKNLISVVKNSLLLVRQWKIEQEILETQTELQKLGINLVLGNLLKNISQNKNGIISELEQKQKNLNYIIKLVFLEDLKNLVAKFDNETISPLLEKYSTPIDSGEINSLRKEKQQLEIIKQRYEKFWRTSCDEYKKLEDDFKDNLKPAEEKAFNGKKEYAEKVFADYEKSINTIIEKLGANFRLMDFSVPQHRRGNLKLFSIKFLDSDTIIDIEGKENQYNFKNTLSHSDKRLLAFAFFVVDIQNTENLENTIVVLDDPMSSFDVERKITTIKVLRDDLINSSKQTPNQLIILTHEKNFFIFLNEHFSNEKTFLRIIFSNSENTSKIVPCDIEEDFLKETHLKVLEEFKMYLDGKVGYVNLGEVRKRLEHLINIKYHLEIPSEVKNSGGVVYWYKEEIAKDNIKTKINDLFPSLSHHDQIARIKEEDLEDGDKKDIIKNLLSILKEI